jgi:hypothetical protein
VSGPTRRKPVSQVPVTVLLRTTLSVAMYMLLSGSIVVTIPYVSWLTTRFFSTTFPIPPPVTSEASSNSHGDDHGAHAGDYPGSDAGRPVVAYVRYRQQGAR